MIRREGGLWGKASKVRVQGWEDVDGGVFCELTQPNVLGARFVLGSVLGTWGTSRNQADSGSYPLGFIFQHSEEKRKEGTCW